ncbi:DUF1016 domain-containing protein [Arthrobacter sp. R3-55]
MNKTLERTGNAPSNFTQQLAAQSSELAQQVAKDPYNFEFLGLSGEVAERDLENALTSRITETLRELGPGFSCVGRQVHVDVDGDDFYVELLFFHVDQNRYVVVGKFQPEYAGKLNFYVALVDDMLRREHHNETHRDSLLRYQERSQRPIQPRPLKLTHGGRNLHLRQTPGRRKARPAQRRGRRRCPRMGRANHGLRELNPPQPGWNADKHPYVGLDAVSVTFGLNVFLNCCPG